MTLDICDVEGHVCQGHRCDRCVYCESGTCCGEAVVTIDLPAQGSWEGQTHAPIGEIHLDGDGKIICHICGEAFVGLYKHIGTHGVKADSYRSLFGLRTTQSLMAPVNSDARAERTGQQMRAMTEDERKVLAERLAEHRQSFTPEQRSTWAYAREERAQSQMPGSFRDPLAQAARSASFHAQRRQNPDIDRRWKGKLIIAKRRTIDPGRACSICGTRFCTVNARGIRQNSPRATCGLPECVTEAKRRAQAKSAQSRRANKAARLAQEAAAKEQTGKTGKRPTAKPSAAPPDTPRRRASSKAGTAPTIDPPTRTSRDAARGKTQQARTAGAAGAASRKRARSEAAE